jgi:hypothetical protein
MAAPPVKVILAAWMSTSPAPPGPNLDDEEILAPFIVRIEVEMEMGPACPNPNAGLVIALPLFSVTKGPMERVPGRKPDMVIDSAALICMGPLAPSPKPPLLINPPSLRVNCSRRKVMFPAAPALNASDLTVPGWSVSLGVWTTTSLPEFAERFSL